MLTITKVLAVVCNIRWGRRCADVYRALTCVRTYACTETVQCVQAGPSQPQGPHSCRTALADQHQRQWSKGVHPASLPHTLTPHCLTAALPHCLTAALPHCAQGSGPHSLTVSLPASLCRRDHLAHVVHTMTLFSSHCLSLPHGRLTVLNDVIFIWIEQY